MLSIGNGIEEINLHPFTIFPLISQILKSPLALPLTNVKIDFFDHFHAKK